MSGKPLDCFYANNHALVWSDGYVLPCCNYKAVEDPIGDYTKVSEFFNSPELRKLRDDHSNGIKRQGCRKCWQVEDAGGISHRKPVNPRHAGQLKSLDIAAGRTCTLKCRTCGPHASTAWESEMASRGIKGDWANVDINELPDSLYGNLEHLVIQGGEPFLSKKLPVMLERLASTNVSDNIDLIVVTNGEWFPDERFTVPLKRFKRLSIRVSIDGVGARNEYIRSGSNWERTLDTVERWGRFKLDNPGAPIRLSVNHTISTFNFIYYDEMVSEIGRMRTLPGLWDLELLCSHALDDSWHNCFMLPQPLKDEAARIWATGSPRRYEFQNFRRIMVGMLSTPRSAPSASFESWWGNNAELDRLRGQDIRESLPELVDLLNRHGLPAIADR